MYDIHVLRQSSKANSDYYSKQIGFCNDDRVFCEVGSEFLNTFNPLNAEVNPICPLLALFGAHHILHVSRIRVKSVLCVKQLSYRSKGS